MSNNLNMLMAEAVYKSKLIINKSKSSNKKKTFNSKTCVNFGIFDCKCCAVKQTINNMSSENEEVSLSLKDKSNLINVKPSVSTSKTSQIELNLLNEPSTSSKTDSDVRNFVNYISSEVNSEKEREMKEYEEKFLIKKEDLSSIKNNIISNFLGDLAQEEEEIDVVSILPEEINTENQITTDIEQQTEQINESVAFLDVVENDEEIDVVNLPLNEDIINNLQESSSDNINNKESAERKTKRSRSPARNENMTSENVQNQFGDEEEIDVVNLPINFDEDAPLSTYINITPAIPKRKRRKSIRNNLQPTRNILQPTNEEEIIDVVNLTDDVQDRAALSDALVAANCALDLRRTRSRSTVIDLMNVTPREDSIIEISDSPIVISEVIDIDDDDTDSTPIKSNWGNCPVCFEDLSKSEIMSTMCGHVFCSVCIRTVIKTTKKCPKCRKHLTLKSIHPLFF